MPADEPVCRRQAMDLLARREHSRLELERKLAARGHPAELIESVLDGLEHDGLLAEDRFVEAFVRSRVARGQGPIRIRAELRQRGIGDCAAALEPYAGDWTRLAGAARVRRFGVARPVDRAERARQARFLEGRGFAAEQIYDALEFTDDSD